MKARVLRTNQIIEVEYLGKLGKFSKIFRDIQSGIEYTEKDIVFCFDFNSSVCTDRHQSERLLALGLKKETADMCRYKDRDGYWMTGLVEETEQEKIEYYEMFAWSFDRLRKMLPKVVWYNDVLERKYHPIVEYESVNYVTEDGTCLFDEGNDVWESMLSTIEWLIKEGYFNKEYLV